jgi:cytosine/uracil/thiamine/allantoin permease
MGDIDTRYEPNTQAIDLTLTSFSWGTNWRAAVVTVFIVTPLLPGLAHAISPPNVSVNSGIDHLYAISWLYGFHASILLYYALAYLWPVSESLVSKTVSGPADLIEGLDVEGRIAIIVPDEKGEKEMSTT